MKIKVDLDLLTVDQFEALTEAIGKQGQSGSSVVKESLCRFVVDDDGKPVPLDTAKAFVGGLPVSTALRAAGEITRSIKALMDGAVPNASAPDSPSP